MKSIPEKEAKYLLGWGSDVRVDRYLQAEALPVQTILDWSESHVGDLHLLATGVSKAFQDYEESILWRTSCGPHALAEVESALRTQWPELGAAECPMILKVFNGDWPIACELLRLWMLALSDVVIAAKGAPFALQMTNDAELWVFSPPTTPWLPTSDCFGFFAQEFQPARDSTL
ncbi:hypothetical protein ASA1KI_12100 [Opitutales bacterium ASA1]|uniref:hypothetical protein n=1 Tax=Congregicoccus parvus TaxID=3081749 RepID=UPI002B29D29A|nr:hypothetical protein ASA1KI_12100 [Opitutales bacterium ASA1]